MKIVLITPLVPYKENLGGASALPYHLLKGRPENVDVTVYSFNSNRLTPDKICKVENELNVSIKTLREAWWRKWLFRLHLTFIRLFLKYPINYYRHLRRKELEDIKKLQPDIVWCYTQELSHISKQFHDYRRLHTLPDCYSLHFYRRMGLRSVMNFTFDRWNVIANYIKHWRMETEYDTSDNIIYHLVGKADKDFLLTINSGLNAHFIRHPHYEISNEREIHFHRPKIRLLIAGRYDLYSQQTSDDLFPYLSHLPMEQRKLLQSNYTITFLGKGWEHYVEMLRNAGYDAKHIIYAPDYIEEIIKHDVQLNPVSVGTGTKGKVLDALANGLLMVGTPYALENIAVENGVSCVEWTSIEEVPRILIDIAANYEKYEQIAIAGRNAVLCEHNPRRISKEILSLLKN